MGDTVDLTKQDIKDLRRSLEEWRTPAEMQAKCDDLRKTIDGLTVFTKGGLTFLTEAFVAARFATDRAAPFVRLVPEVEQRPDFELDFGGRMERFEMVQADRKGRRRGDEYRAEALLPPGTIIHYDPPLPQEVIEMVRCAARKKAKPYPPHTRLMIYLEAENDDELLPYLVNVVGDARPFFSAIWISWQGRFHEVFSVS